MWEMSQHKTRYHNTIIGYCEMKIRMYKRNVDHILCLKCLKTIQISLLILYFCLCLCFCCSAIMVENIEGYTF